MVITLLVLLIDASLNSKSPAPQQSLAAGAWVDRILPIITTSNTEGQVLDSIWANGLHMPASSVAAQIDQVSSGAAQNYQAAVKLRPPDNLGGPAGLLEAALLARSKAAQDLQNAFRVTLGAAAVAPGTRATATSTPPAADPTTVVPDISTAGSEIQVGDQAYQLFLTSVPASLGKMPASAWGANPAPYAPQAAQVFLASMQSAASTAPVYRVRVLGISTTPAPVSTRGATQIIPDATAMTLDIVMADTGNQPADNLTVTAAIAPAGSGSASVRDFVNLGVGQAYTITGLGPLNPPQGVPVTLTVTVTPPAGSSMPPATQSLVFQMPAPPPPSTTTVPGATTVPGSTTVPAATPPTT